MSMVYIVEDHKSIADGVGMYLRIYGFETRIFYNLSDARKALESTVPDVIIQDVMLPDGDGFEFVNEIRKTCDVPVIFMTARVSESDRITGFELGADDYITKPFSTKELVLRVQALLRRTQAAKQQNAVQTEGLIRFCAASSVLDYNPQTHEIAVDGNSVKLTSAEYRVLSMLLEGAPETVSRADILKKCFGYSYESYERIADTHIKNIRAKLGNSAAWIETVRGFGYRFTGLRQKEEE